MFSTGNKYGSIVETFQTDPLLDVTLSTLATPPANLVLSDADFGAGTGKPLYWRTTISATGRRPNFNIHDVPRLVGYGLNCNIGDGLVYNDTVMTPAAGLILGLAWNSYTSGGVLSQSNFTGGATMPQFSAKVMAFNTLYPCSFQWDFSALNVAQAAVRGLATIRVGASNSNWATITVDPLFAAKRLVIWPTFIIEHSYPIDESVAV